MSFLTKVPHHFLAWIPNTPKSTNHQKGPGDTRPTALQIVNDAGCEDNFTGKVILITGCSSGLGIEIARALYRTMERKLWAKTLDLLNENEELHLPGNEPVQGAIFRQ